jgi:hypothetical protein
MEGEGGSRLDPDQGMQACERGWAHGRERVAQIGVALGRLVSSPHRVGIALSDGRERRCVGVPGLTDDREGIEDRVCLISAEGRAQEGTEEGGSAEQRTSGEEGELHGGWPLSELRRGGHRARRPRLA